MKAPILKICLAAAFLLFAASSIAEAKKRKKEKEPEPPPAPKIEVIIPADIPVYPEGAKVDEGYDVIEQRLYFIIETTDAREKLYEFYVSRIKKEGWRILNMQKYKKLTAEKDPARFLETDFFTKDEKSYVKVMWF